MATAALYSLIEPLYNMTLMGEKLYSAVGIKYTYSTTSSIVIHK